MQTENHCLNQNGNVWGNHFHYEQVHSEEVPQAPVTLEGNMVWCKYLMSWGLFQGWHLKEVNTDL